MAGCKALADQEVAGLLAAFHGTYAARNRAMFLLGVKTGYRVSELLSLRLVDVFRFGRVVERVTVARRHMKLKTTGRTVPLQSDAQEALGTWIRELEAAGAGPDTYLFRSRKGRNAPILRRQALKVLRAAFDAEKLTGPLGTHVMRKTFARKVHAASGGDIFKTQKALGHSSPMVTIRYLQSCQEDIDRLIMAI